jgi:hypothetical protein
MRMCVISVHHLVIFKIELVMVNMRMKLTISDKLDVFAKVEAHPNVPYTGMANHFGLHLRKAKPCFRKRKSDMQNLSMGHRPRSSNLWWMQYILLEMFRQIHSHYVPILWEKAYETILYLNTYNFKASHRQLHEFGPSHDVGYRTLGGESGSIYRHCTSLDK